MIIKAGKFIKRRERDLCISFTRLSARYCRVKKLLSFVDEEKK
jgi:hypothetical protein